MNGAPVRLRRAGASCAEPYGIRRAAPPFSERGPQAGYSGSCDPIEERDFTSWSMGFARLSLAEIRDTPGLNPFFQDYSTLIDLRPGRARRLLEEFKAGRWRMRLR